MIFEIDWKLVIGNWKFKISMNNLSSKIHIVHIIPTLGIGGAERFVVDLIKHSDPNKFKFSVIVLKPIFDLQSELPSDCQVILVEKKGKISLNLISKIKKQLEILQPDIVHTHLFGGDVWGRVAAKKLKLPVVTTEHNLNLQESIFKHQIKECLRNYSDIYTAPSEAVADYLKKIYQVKKDIKVIRHGIELTKFLNNKKNNIQKIFRLLMLGRLTPQKGHRIVIKALVNLPEYDWKLEIVGSGPDEKKLKNLVNKNNLSNKITFYPATKTVLEVFQRNDIFLMPSLWEGLGITVMEAMTSGLLVVASNVDGLKELIVDAQTGYLLEAENVRIWQDKLRNIFEGKTEVDKIAKAGVEFAKNNFSIEKMVSEYEKVYQSLV